MNQSLEIMKKTIEERAKEYEEKYYDGCASEARLAFIRGAQSERAELTRWRDPKEELPKDDEAVLVKIEGLEFNKFEVCKYSDGYWWVKAPIAQGGWCGADFKIVSWRPII